MSQVKAVFYLPMRDNDGRDLSAEAAAVRRELFIYFDGWTHLGMVTGAYRMLNFVSSRTGTATMNKNEIENEIRRLLVDEPRAASLSNKLFSPAGLFSQLARTGEQRRALADSDIFVAAQARLSELERRDAVEFAKAIKQNDDHKKLTQSTSRVEHPAT